MEQDFHSGQRPQTGLQDRIERIEREIELIAGSIRLATGGGLAGVGEAPPVQLTGPLARDRVSLRPGFGPGIVNNPAQVAKQERQQKAKLARRIISERRRREQTFGSELFADPAWDMLLDLYAAHQEQRQVSISSLCIAAAVPATTALRWIRTMADKGLLCRAADENDGRRIYVHLEEKVLTAMDEFLEAHAEDWARAPI